MLPSRQRCRLRRALTKGSPIRFLLLLAFLGTFGTAQFEAIFGLFMLDRHGYSPEQVGGILTLVGVVAVIGRGVLTGWLTRWWGEATVIKASLLAGAGGFVLLLLAETYVTVLLTTGLFVLITTFLRPAIHSLTSQRATIGQGAAMGLSSSFVSLGRGDLRPQSELSVRLRRGHPVARIRDERDLDGARGKGCRPRVPAVEDSLRELIAAAP